MQIKMQEYEHIIIYYIGGWEIGKTESKASSAWAADDYLQKYFGYYLIFNIELS